MRAAAVAMIVAGILSGCSGRISDQPSETEERVADAMTATGDSSARGRAEASIQRADGLGSDAADSAPGRDAGSVSDASQSVDPAGLLAIHPVTWNVSNAPVGNVAALTELGTTVVIFGDMGAITIGGGTIAGMDSSVRGWLAAGTIPAPDGSGSWAVGIDSDGHIKRVGASMTLVDVSARFGMAQRHARAVAKLSATATGFAVDTGIVVTQGTTITQYTDPMFGTFVGASGRMAGVSTDLVRVFTASTMTRVSYPLPDARFATFDATGKLVVATTDTLFVENARGDLEPRYRAAGSVIHGLATSGTRVWFALGTELGVLEASGVRHTRGAGLPPTASLVGSPSGDIWSIDAGRLTRFAADSTAPQTPVQQWQETVLPIFSRVCSNCHVPGRTSYSGHDLSTYEQWTGNAAAIRNRVIVVQTMPPPGYPFADADRGTIGAWLSMLM